MTEKNSLSPRDSLAVISMKILDPYRRRYLDAVDQVLVTLGPDSKLRKACAYALKIGGKRLRPAIVYMVAEAIAKEPAVDLPAMIVEFFHVSSLICDDLPCMDDDDFRRGEPTTHRVFSESIALLASFALTAAGFELLSQISNENGNAEAILRTSVREASRSVGLIGLIGGQHFDLYPEELAELSEEEAILTIMDMKTGALFTLSFLFGWIFGGGDLSRLEELKEISKHFGRVFQILDDIDDYEQDIAAGKRVNFAIQVGLDKAKRSVSVHLESFKKGAIALGLAKSPLLQLTEAMRSLVDL